MTHDWIIDVLADLKAYAALNGLEATAAQIEDASLVALAEIGSIEAQEARRVPFGPAKGGHDGTTGNVTRLFARRGLA